MKGAGVEGDGGRDAYDRFGTQPDDDAPTTSASEGSGGGGSWSGDERGHRRRGGCRLLALFGGGVVWRRGRAKARCGRQRGGDASRLRGDRLDQGARSCCSGTRRRRRGRTWHDRDLGLLGAASSLPSSDPCARSSRILGDVEEFSEKADDVLVAARRVVDVLDVVDLMSKNVSKCSDGKERQATCSGSSTY